MEQTSSTFKSLFLLLIAAIIAFSLSTHGDERLYRTPWAHASECMNFLTELNFAGYVAPAPERQIELYAALRDGLTYNNSYIRLVWEKRGEEYQKDGDIFRPSNLSDKIVIDYPDVAEQLTTLGYGIVQARLDYQEALLNYLSSVDGDLASINKVVQHASSIFEHSELKAERLDEYKKRQGDAFKYSAWLKDQFDHSRINFIVSQQRLQGYLRKLDGDGVELYQSFRLGIPNISVIRASLLRELQEETRVMKKDQENREEQITRDSIKRPIRIAMAQEDFYFRRLVERREEIDSLKQNWIELGVRLKEKEQASRRHTFLLIKFQAGNENKLDRPWAEAEAFYKSAYFFSLAQIDYLDLLDVLLKQISADHAEEFHQMTVAERGSYLQKITGEIRTLRSRMVEHTRQEITADRDLNYDFSP